MRNSGLLAKPVVRVLLLLAVLLVALLLINLFTGKRAKAPNQQPVTPNAETLEQLNDNTQGAADMNTPVQPDINSQEFKLTSSNVSCSTSTVNGSTVRNCSGSIRVTPLAQSDMEPGLYKINEQTKLLHAGAEQDLNSLQQLSQAQTVVRLHLVDGSNDTLSQISY